MISRVELNFRLDRSQCPGKNLPGKSRFSYEAQEYIGSLPVEVVTPFTNLAVLKYHVQGKAEEKYEQCRQDKVDEGRDTTICGR